MNCDEIFSLGYTQEDIDKIKVHPYIGHYNIGILCDKIKNVYNYFLSIGFSNEETLFITRRYLGIFACDVELLEQKSGLGTVRVVAKPFDVGFLTDAAF